LFNTTGSVDPSSSVTETCSAVVGVICARLIPAVPVFTDRNTVYYSRIYASAGRNGNTGLLITLRRRLLSAHVYYGRSKSQWPLRSLIVVRLTVMYVVRISVYAYFLRTKCLVHIGTSYTYNIVPTTTDLINGVFIHVQRIRSRDGRSWCLPRSMSLTCFVYVQLG